MLMIRLWPRWVTHGCRRSSSSSIKSCRRQCILSVVTLKFNILFGQNFLNYCLRAFNMSCTESVCKVVRRCVQHNQFFWFLSTQQVFKFPGLVNCLRKIIFPDMQSWIVCHLWGQAIFKHWFQIRLFLCCSSLLWRCVGSFLCYVQLKYNIYTKSLENKSSG